LYHATNNAVMAIPHHWEGGCQHAKYPGGIAAHRGSCGRCERRWRCNPYGINRVARAVYRWWRCADHRLLIAEILYGIIHFTLLVYATTQSIRAL
jgi:hypothetical protein